MSFYKAKRKALSITTCLVVGLAYGSARAAPSYKQARAVYDQLEKPVSITLLWDKKSEAEIHAATRDAIVLNTQANALFDNNKNAMLHPCSQAASLSMDYVASLNSVWRSTRGGKSMSSFDMNASLRTSYLFGVAKNECRAEIDKLYDSENKSSGKTLRILEVNPTKP